MHVQLEDFKITDEYTVHWSDMDVANHVNNLVYLKWTETLRMSFFEICSIDASCAKDSIGPILGAQTCKYIFPMRFPDKAIVGLKILAINDDHFVILSGVFSEKHQRIACWSSHEVIPYDYGTLRRAPLPDNWVQALKPYL